MSEAYPVYRVEHPIQIDGKLSDPAWSQVRKSSRFGDMATGEPAMFNTQAALLWDDEFLYIGFWVEEPYPKAHLTERDSIIFNENDIEIFIDGGDCYYEFEINALGTIYEIMFIWRDAFTPGSRFDIPEFDLMRRKVLSFAGNFDRAAETFWWGTHPRGVRWAFLDWDLPGLQTSVHIDGVLNDPSTVSKGWTVEMAIPWSGLHHLANGRSLPPQDGDEWSLFLGRFQNIPLGETKAQAAWCWTPHGVYDTHMPDKFTKVCFVDKVLDEG